MANGNTSSADTVVILTSRQWEGLGRVGDAALQVQNLLQIFQNILSELPYAIDTDMLLAKYEPQLNALRETAGLLQSILSMEGGAERLTSFLDNVRDAQIDKTTSELLAILNNLQKAGFFSSLAALSGELPCRPLLGGSPDELLAKLRGASTSLQYYLESARQGIRAAGTVASQMELPEQLDEIQEMAIRWLQLAGRVQRLIQGDAPTLHARLEELLEMAEALGGQVGVAVGTLKDTAPELLAHADISGALGTVSTAGRRWIHIVLRLKTLVQGDSKNLAGRAEALLDQVEKVADYVKNAEFFLQAGKDGLSAARNLVADMDLPEKLDLLAEGAEKWLQIALRAKKLAQGKSENLADRISDLLDSAEMVANSLGAAANTLEKQGIDIREIFSPKGDLGIAMGTGADLIAELWRDGTFLKIGSSIGQGVMAWVEIAQMGGKALQGSAPSITARVKDLVRELDEAKLMDMLPELLALAGKVQQSSMLHKASLVLDRLLPLMPSDDEFASGLDKAVQALQKTGAEMKNESSSGGGGIFGLIRIFFARDTQYVLRYAVRFSSLFLKALKR